MAISNLVVRTGRAGFRCGIRRLEVRIASRRRSAVIPTCSILTEDRVMLADSAKRPRPGSRRSAARRGSLKSSRAKRRGPVTYLCALCDLGGKRRPALLRRRRLACGSALLGGTSAIASIVSSQIRSARHACHLLLHASARWHLGFATQIVEARRARSRPRSCSVFPRWLVALDCAMNRRGEHRQPAMMTAATAQSLAAARRQTSGRKKRPWPYRSIRRPANGVIAPVRPRDRPELRDDRYAEGAARKSTQR